MDRALEVIRRRIDQFGVAEPLIQREGEDRIALQLPGLTDRERELFEQLRRESAYDPRSSS